MIEKDIKQIIDIKELQRLYIELNNETEKQEKEIERLKKQWGKLEHWLKTDKKDAMITFETGRCFNYRDVLDKIKELKGVDKDENKIKKF